MSISLASIPGFTEVPDTSFAAGQPVTDSIMKSLNAASKFGVVRNEQFWGFYQHSEIVLLPTSPADGYVYSREELVYSWSVYWTGAGPGSLQGTQTTPSRGATSGPGTLLQAGYLVNPTTGEVICNASYWNGQETDTHDGILMVITHAQRLR
jgi:hypothetical protein